MGKMEQQKPLTSTPVPVKRKHTTEAGKAKKSEKQDQDKSPNHNKAKPNETEYNSGVSEYEDASSGEDADLDDSISSNAPLILLTQNRKRPAVDYRKKAIIANQSQAKTEASQTEPEKEKEEDEVKVLLQEIKTKMITQEGLNETLDARITDLVKVLATKEELGKVTVEVQKVEVRLKNSRN